MSRRAFTLIEVLVVLAIMAILTGLLACAVSYTVSQLAWQGFATRAGNELIAP